MVFPVVFIALMLLGASLAGNWALAVYSLSFWHYYLYWLAYRYGAVPLAEFRRDAVALKSVSLLALGSVYLAFPLDWVSVAVVTGGFLLNACAAKALGSARTYYGHEAAGLPRLKITAFPYSWISHPMLVGNIAAFGGTLINAGFRRYWWPLALAHVALNAGLLIMELLVTPLRRGIHPAPPSALSRGLLTGSLLASAGAALGGAWTHAAHAGIPVALGAVLGACIGIYAVIIYLRYSPPTFGTASPGNTSSTESL